MKIKDYQLTILSFIGSLSIHAVVFIQFTNTTASISEQAQARTYDTRVSLNLLVAGQKQNEVEVKTEKPDKNSRAVIKKKKEIKKNNQEQAVAPRISEEVRRKQQDDVTEIKQRYFSVLLTHIEGHKYYPHAARQSGYEGVIQVSFRLMSNGNISELSANGGSVVLRRAAMNAVRRSLPLPACPDEITCPLQISYAMQFKLHDKK